MFKNLESYICFKNSRFFNKLSKTLNIKNLSILDLKKSIYINIKQTKKILNFFF